MRARDIMTTSVVTVSPGTDIAEAVKLMLERQVSGIPVIDDSGRLIGILTKGDLMRRAELVTGRQSQWTNPISSPEQKAKAYVKAHKGEVGMVGWELQITGRRAMHIEELTRKASIDFVASRRLGHLASANQGQPYITPCYFAYHDQWIYSFSIAGQKIDWLRANPLACLEMDEIKSFEEWTSVVVFGRYEELTKSLESQARELAYQLLQQQHQCWWEPGYSRTVRKDTSRPLDPVYYRLSIDEISGHRATPS